jgi:hypothetical protein
LKTIAGSSRITLRIARTAESAQIRITAPALIARTCQGRRKASSEFFVAVADERREADAEAVADHADEERLQARSCAGASWCARPIALSAPNCFRLSSVKLWKVWPAMIVPDEEAERDGDPKFTGMPVYFMK